MNKRKFLVGSAIGVATLAALGLLASANSQSNLKYAGRTMTIVTFDGPQIGEPLKRHAPEFEKMTGAKINVVLTTFSDLFPRILTDFTSGSNTFDAGVFDPQWLGDYVPSGYLEPLDSYIAKTPSLKWNEITPFFREFSATYAGKTYMIPLDGDFQMVYYRRDLWANKQFKTDFAAKYGYGLTPPKTWTQYRDMAEFFNGKTVDGVKMYGAVEAQKRNAQSFWVLGSRAGGYMQYKGTGQGMFFDSNNMKPLINAAGFVRALTEWKDIQKSGPANMVNFDTGDVRSAFVGGQAALAIDWGDIGSLSTDKKTSVIQGKVGAVILPGSKEIWNRDTNKWVTKNAVNYAPYAAFGGWSGAVNAKSKNKDIAFDYLAFLSQPENSDEDVTLGITGFNPYRQSHFNNSSIWIKSGMTKEDASNYLGAIKASLKSKNLVLDIRLPGTDRYQKLLDEGIARALAGEESAQAALDGVSQAWDKLTDELGRKKQLTIYRASLKLKSLEGN